MSTLTREQREFVDLCGEAEELQERAEESEAGGDLRRAAVFQLGADARLARARKVRERLRRSPFVRD